MKRSLLTLLLVGLLVLLAAMLATATSGAPPVRSLTVGPTTWTPTATVLIPTDQVFTLTYSGKGNSGPLSISLEGAGANSFILGADTCAGATLSSRKPTCTTTVRFIPQSAGTHPATYSVTGRNVSASAALTGTGETLPGLAINDAPLAYSNSSNNIVTFTVTMEATRPSNVTFNWAANDWEKAEEAAIWGNTCNGSADYTSAAKTGTGTITAGHTTTTIPFGTCTNGPAWGPPMTFRTYFTVTISAPSGATITTGADTGIGTIGIS